VQLLLESLRSHCPRAFLPLPPAPSSEAQGGSLPAPVPVPASAPTADLDSFLASSAVGPPNPLRGLGQVSTDTEVDREVGSTLT